MPGWPCACLKALNIFRFSAGRRHIFRDDQRGRFKPKPRSIEPRRNDPKGRSCPVCRETGRQEYRAVLTILTLELKTHLAWISIIPLFNCAAKALVPNLKAGMQMHAWYIGRPGSRPKMILRPASPPITWPGCKHLLNESFRWNQEALNRAERVKDDSVKSFYPSLYLNMGHSYELLGHLTEAQRYYDLAAQLGFPHQPE